MFLSKSIPFLLLHIWVGFVILCIGSLKFNSCAAGLGDTTISASSGCLEGEREALIHLKQGLKDPGNRLSSWVGDDCCGWAGIYCDNKTGHVVKLILRGQSQVQSSSPIETYGDAKAEFNRSCISGEIHPTLLELKYLRHLDLSINCFGGRVIPKFIGSFKHLSYLNLSASGFGGRVPHEIGNLSTLTYLDLENDRMITVNTRDDDSYSLFVPAYDLHVDRIDWLSRLSSLQYLDMGSVNFGTAADWLLSINMLPSLSNLHLSSCQLPSISTSLPHLNLTSLSTLDLSWNGLGPQIPTWLFNNSRLVSLDLSFNGFTYPIPTALGNLCNLQTLNLYGNNFNAEIEKFNESFKGCIESRLEDLDLGGNMLSGYLPDWLGQFINLKSLSLSLNSLSGPGPILPSFERLSSLTLLDLSENPLSSIPPSLGRLSSLKRLDLSASSLSGSIPPSLGRLSSLTRLDLSANSLSGSIPPSLGRLSSLTRLYLNVNSLSGSIPPSLGRLSSLTRLELSANSLSGSIPPSLGRLSFLTILDLSVNSLSGSIPASLGALSSLEDLHLSRNSLFGSIPPPLGRLSSLTILDLSANSLSGLIPASLGALLSLEYLNLSKNSLFGSIPPSLGRLSSLRTLDIKSNKMNGSIPESLGQLSNLTSLYLSNNSFEGVLLEAHFFNLIKLSTLSMSSTSLVFNVSSSWVPPFQLSFIIMDDCNLGPQFPLWFQTQKQLSYLSLSNASISSPISNIFQILPSNLQFLDLSSNSISGSIINSNIVKTTNLLYLSLSSNRLKGSIPLSICQMKTITYLNFSNNQLSHEIPRCLGDLRILNALILDNNNLSGDIPSSISHLSWLTSLHLSKNKLSGELPPSMKNCTGLVTLDLGENGFSGKIPKWIGERLSFLKFLILRSNKFDGSIPPQLSLLSELQVLDLSENNLSGTIPGSFGNFSAMAVANKTNEIINIGGDFSRLERIWVFWKGFQYEYSSTVSLLININLAGNDLHGEIPREITHLFGLQSLNLSKNQLIGTIPENICDLQQIESLDLSWNQLSGAIPHSLSYMTFLSHLNLSHNNFSGKIPSGNQLDTINDSSIYMGNPLLCGLPLLNQCPRDSQLFFDGDKEDRDELGIQLFYISMAPGFVVGFWVVCGILLIKRSWRLAYYHFFDDMRNRLYVMMAKRSH